MAQGIWEVEQEQEGVGDDGSCEDKLPLAEEHQAQDVAYLNSTHFILVIY